MGILCACGVFKGSDIEGLVWGKKWKVRVVVGLGCDYGMGWVSSCGIRRREEGRERQRDGITSVEPVLT